MKQINKIKANPRENNQKKKLCCFKIRSKTNIAYITDPQQQQEQ